MFRRGKFALLTGAVMALLLSACAVASIPAAQEEQAGGAATPAAAAEETDSMAAAGSEAEFQRILACVEENFPAESYFANELLPDPDAVWEPMDCTSVDRIIVGMSWILNDGAAPWYNAIELGYFDDVCLEIEMARGGPNVDQVQRLADGEVDIAIDASGSRAPAIIASPTAIDLVAVGTFLKHSPYVWLGLDHDTPQDQRSDKVLTPQDFIGKKVGIYAGEEYRLAFLSGKYGIAADQVELMEAIAIPDPALVGDMDYTAAWIVNEPRLMEEKGYMNWVAYRFSDWGWDAYADVSVVRRETLEENPDLVRRYLAATAQGIRYMLENPDASADIAVRYGVDAQLTREQVLRRFELQEALVIGNDDLPISQMSAERWDAQVASMIQYGQLELAICE